MSEKVITSPFVFLVVFVVNKEMLKLRKHSSMTLKWLFQISSIY